MGFRKLSGRTIQLPYKIVSSRQHDRRCIGVDLVGLLGGRMASAEGGSVPRGVGYGEGCPLSSRLRGLGERREPKTDFGIF